MFVRQLYVNASLNCRLGIHKLSQRKWYNPNYDFRRYKMTESIIKRRNAQFEVRKDNSSLIDISLKQKTNVVLDDLRITVDNKTAMFNLTWLRDSCHCDQCTHQHSRQRLYTAKDFRQSHFEVGNVDLVSVDKDNISRTRIIQGDPEGGLVRIDWSDGHVSLYSLEWLFYIDKFCSRRQLNHRDTIERTEFKFPQDDFYLPKSETAIKEDFWDIDQISNGLQQVDYNDLLDGFQFDDRTTFINANRLSDMSPRRLDAITVLMRNLVKYGLTKLVNVPCERDYVLKVARSLAYERPTGYGVVFDVVVEPSEQINLAYSSREFDLHTDLPYRESSPGVQLLHCISNTTHGGLSYFSDAFRAAEKLRREQPQLFDILVNFPVLFTVKDPYRDMNFRRHQPIISLDHVNKLKSIHYSPFTLPPLGHSDDVKLFYVAQDVLTSYLQADDSKLVTKMVPGDLYMFHNRRVLHGRSGYDATKSRRFLQGCYMDWDEIVALEEKIRNQQITG